ncbi:MAG: polysulfide reductase NrfD [Gammaproteobacteria bacterium]|nr:polysulfide reductase NrfD [Gammaproteobacteria bacterium]MDH5175094.1 polysulfide reductase NrfD [Gammaproteobacteria bacterium]MDH5226065.1 polysulfide reductase NrfD [Gammaproteobacteria bacterium]
MSSAIPESLHEQLSHQFEQVIGFIYPNEVETQWAILIVVYPYITGIVAGAFILASLVKVFNVVEVQPIYRLALLTALAFMLVAGMPLQLHLGHPERAYEIFMTPQPTSAMAMFGFVYLWYLLGILLIEIWFEYRQQLVLMARQARGMMKGIYGALSLFSRDLSPEALAFDKKASKFVTVIGIPSAFLLHGYVGFIFGSVKANPWWGSVLMPIVFLMSAIVSGIAMVMFIYILMSLLRNEKLDMRCLDKVGLFLLVAIIVDFALEALDYIHRIYQSEESIGILTELVAARLFTSLVIVQLLLGMLVPLLILVLVRIVNLNEELRKLLYFSASVLILLGIFSMRWNVVIGGQLYSKSFRGLMAYKMEITGIESLVTALALLALPFIILTVLFRLLPPRWMETRTST